MLNERFSPTLLRQLEQLRLRSRKSFLGHRQGGHTSPKRGHGIEFADYRQYYPGDNLRNIDWALYARSEKLHVKLYREEATLSVLLLLDTSMSMGFDNKWEAACDIALALAFIALNQQDSVTICAVGRVISPTFSGGNSIAKVASFLKQIKLNPEQSSNTQLLPELRSCLSRLKYPGVAVYLSDFLFDRKLIEKQISLLRARDLDITLSQILGESDVEPLKSESPACRVLDSETGEELPFNWTAEFQRQYGELLVDHNEYLRNFAHSGRNSYCLVLSRQPILEIITEIFPNTGLVG